MDENIIGGADRVKGRPKQTVVPAFNPGQMTNPDVRKAFQPQIDDQAHGGRSGGSGGITPDEKYVLEQRQRKDDIAAKQQQNQLRAQQANRTEQLKIARERRNQTFQGYAELTGREHGKDEYGNAAFSEPEELYKERTEKARQEKIASLRQDRAKAREDELRKQQDIAAFHRDDKNYKPLSDSEREKKAEEYQRGITGLRAQLQIPEDAPDSEIEKFRDKAPKRLEQLDAIKKELDADEGNRKRYNEYDDQAQTAKGRLIGAIPDKPLSVFEMAEKKKQLAEREAGLAQGQEEIKAVADTARQKYETTLAGIEQGLAHARQAGMDIHQMAESTHAARMAKLQAEADLYEDLQGVQLAESGLDEEMMSFNLDIEELNARAELSNQTPGREVDPSEEPMEGAAKPEQDTPEVSTPAVTTPDGRIELNGEELGEERQFGDQRAIIAETAESAAKILKSSQKDTPVYATEAPEGDRISDEEVDGVTGEIKSRSNDLIWKMQREQARLAREVENGSLDAAKAEQQFEEAEKQILKDERKGFERNSEILNDSVVQYANGQISAQQLNRIFKASGQEVTGISAFQEIEKEHQKEEAAREGLIERIQKELPAPPTDLFGKEIEGEKFLEEYNKWKADPDNYDGKASPVHFEVYEDRSMEFEDSLRKQLSEQGITGDRAYELIRGATIEGYRTRDMTLGEAASNASYQELLPYWAGVYEAKELLPLAEIAMKLDGGEEVSTEEMEDLESWVVANSREGTFWAGAFEIIKQLPAFGGELLTTGPLYSGGRKVARKAAMETLESVVKKKATSILKKRAGDKFGKSALRWMGRNGVRTAGVMGGAAAQFPVASSTRIYAGTLRDIVNQGFEDKDGGSRFNMSRDDEDNLEILVNDRISPISITQAATRSIGDNYIEVLSEHSGGMFAKIAEPFQAPLMKTAAYRAFKKLNAGLTPKKFRKYVRAAGWNGVVEEWGEERVGEVLRAGLHGVTGGYAGEELQKPSLKQWGQELVSFAIPGGAVAALNQGYRIAVERPLRARIKVADQRLDDFLDGNENRQAEIVNGRLGKLQRAKGDDKKAPDFTGEDVKASNKFYGGSPVKSAQVRAIDSAIRTAKAGLEKARANDSVDRVLAHQRQLAKLHELRSEAVVGVTIAGAQAGRALKGIKDGYNGPSTPPYIEGESDPSAVNPAEWLSAIAKIGAGRPLSELTAAETNAIQYPMESGGIPVDISNENAPIISDEARTAALDYAPSLGPFLTMDETEARQAANERPLTDPGDQGDSYEKAEKPPTEQAAGTGTGRTTAKGMSVGGTSVAVDVPDGTSIADVEKALNKAVMKKNGGDLTDPLDPNTVEYEPRKPGSSDTVSPVGGAGGAGSKSGGTSATGSAKPGSDGGRVVPNGGGQPATDGQSGKTPATGARDEADVLPGEGKSSGGTSGTGGRTSSPDQGSTKGKDGNKGGSPTMARADGANIPLFPRRQSAEKKPLKFSEFRDAFDSIAETLTGLGIKTTISNKKSNPLGWATVSGIGFNPAKLWKKARDTGKMSEEDLLTWVDRIINEEVRHYALRQHVKELWEADGSKGDFKDFLEAYFKNIWKSDFKGKALEKIVRSSYKRSGSTGTDIADWQRAEEGIRMISSMLADGTVTEEMKAQVKGMSDKAKAAIKSIVAFLKALTTKHKDQIPAATMKAIVNMEQQIEQLFGTEKQSQAPPEGLDFGKVLDAGGMGSALRDAIFRDRADKKLLKMGYYEQLVYRANAAGLINTREEFDAVTKAFESVETKDEAARVWADLTKSTDVDASDPRRGIVFGSGLQENPKDLAERIKEGLPVGIVAQIQGKRSVSQTMRKMVAEYANAGGHVFVDSGAFLDFKAGRETDWEMVFHAYHELISMVKGDANRNRVQLVAPDVVGDAEATRALQVKFKDQVIDLHGKGASIIVPIQKEDAAKSNAVQKAMDIWTDNNNYPLSSYFGVHGFSMGFAFNKAPWSATDIIEIIGFIDATGGHQPQLSGRRGFVSPNDPIVRSIHLLGGGGVKVDKILAEVSPDSKVIIGGDSLYKVASQRKGGRTEEQKAAKEGDAPYVDLGKYKHNGLTKQRFGDDAGKWTGVVINPDVHTLIENKSRRYKVEVHSFKFAKPNGGWAYATSVNVGDAISGRGSAPSFTVDAKGKNFTADDVYDNIDDAISDLAKKEVAWWDRVLREFPDGRGELKPSRYITKKDLEALRSLIKVDQGKLDREAEAKREDDFYENFFQVVIPDSLRERQGERVSAIDKAKKSGVVLGPDVSKADAMKGIRPAEAEERINEWKEIARKDRSGGGKIILSMFDSTGEWSQPWRDAGYNVIQVDNNIQNGAHGFDMDVFDINSMDVLGEMGLLDEDVVGVLAACPCTAFSASGNRWRVRHDGSKAPFFRDQSGSHAGVDETLKAFQMNREDLAAKGVKLTEKGYVIEDLEELADQIALDWLKKEFGDTAAKHGSTMLEYSKALVEHSMAVIEILKPSGFWAIENPIGRLKSETPIASESLQFHPHNFGDPFTKNTQIFGYFDANLPLANVNPTGGSYSWNLSGSQSGDKAGAANSRSQTFEGFAYSFFVANMDFTAESQFEKSEQSRKKSPEKKDRGKAAGEQPLPHGGKVSEFVDRQLAVGYVFKEPASLYLADPGLTLALTPDQADYARSISPEFSGKTSDPAEREKADKDADPDNSTQGQREAENAKVGRIKWRGNDISIETPSEAYRWKLDIDGLGDIEQVLGAADAEIRLPFKASMKILKGTGGNKRIPQAFKGLEKVKRELDLREDSFIIERSMLRAILNKAWFNQMPEGVSYGRLLKTEGADGDHLDVFVGPNFELRDMPVTIIDQINQSDGKFDEHKIMVGFETREEAIKAYKGAFDTGWRMGDALTVTPHQFDLWKESTAKFKQPFATWYRENQGNANIFPQETKGPSEAEVLSTIGSAPFGQVQKFGNVSASISKEIGAQYSRSYPSKVWTDNVATEETFSNPDDAARWVTKKVMERLSEPESKAKAPKKKTAKKKTAKKKAKRKLADTPQKRFMQFRRALRAAKKREDWEGVIEEANAFKEYYDRDDTEEYPDQWSEWEREKEDAERMLGITPPLVPPITKPFIPETDVESKEAREASYETRVVVLKTRLREDANSDSKNPVLQRRLQERIDWLEEVIESNKPKVDMPERSDAYFDGSSMRKIKWPETRINWNDGVKWAHKTIPGWNKGKGDEHDRIRGVNNKAKDKIKEILGGSKTGASRPTTDLQFWGGVYDASLKLLEESIAKQNEASLEAESDFHKIQIGDTIQWSTTSGVVDNISDRGGVRDSLLVKRIDGRMVPVRAKDAPTIAVETYINGDKGIYTGESREISGGIFYDVLMSEGSKAGEIQVTSRGPDGVNPSADRSKKEWAEQQESFRRLKPEPKLSEADQALLDVFSDEVGDNPAQAADITLEEREEAQRLVDKKAKGAGWRKIYRGGASEVLKLSAGHEHGVYGVSTTEDKDYAATHGSVYEYYTSARNPIDYFDLVDMYESENPDSDPSDKELTAFALSKGYDSSVLVDPQAGEDLRIFSLKQIESADPFIYDESGNLIPLSQRFNEADTPAQAGELDPVYDEPAPGKIAALVNVAEKYIAEGVDTPQALAERLSVLAGGKLRPYSTIIWSAFGVHNPRGEKDPDWSSIYEQLDSTQTAPESESDETGSEIRSEGEAGKPETDPRRDNIGSSEESVSGDNVGDGMPESSPDISGSQDSAPTGKRPKRSGSRGSSGSTSSDRTPDGKDSKGDDSSRHRDRASVSEPARSPGRGNYVLTDPESIVGGGPKARFKRNQKALEVVDTVTTEDREPTKEELDALAAYTGWGAFGQELFKGTWGRALVDDSWASENEWLRDHLGEKAWKSAQDSILNSHYTDPPTVSAMWAMVEKMGFKGGRVLEPSEGVGQFWSLMPPALTKASTMTGIELDRATAKIVQLLHPWTNHFQMGYQESGTKDNFYDLVIGNWPFAKDGPSDRRYNKLNLSLHNYFFAKAIDQTRPGGIVIGVTSSGTMDSKSATARRYIASRGELVASFRLPTGAFGKYAGTKVVTDIIILRKRETPIEDLSGEKWLESKDDPGGEDFRYNEYYHDNPTHILGDIAFGHGTTFGRAGMIVNRKDDFPAQLEALATRVPEDGFRPWSAPESDAVTISNTDTTLMQNSLVIRDGDLYRVAGEHFERVNDIKKWKLKSEKATNRRLLEFENLIAMRDAHSVLMNAYQKGGDTSAARKDLKKAYDTYKKKFKGRISKSPMLKFMDKMSDPGAMILLNLEDEKGNGRAILEKDIMRPVSPDAAGSIEDAYAIQRNNSLTFNLGDVAEIAGVSEDEARDRLIELGQIFKVPTGEWEARDEYLAGNVRRKLREAEAAVKEGVEGMDINIAALEAIQPPLTHYSEIEVRMGAHWVSKQDYIDYFNTILEIPKDGSDTTQVVKQATGWKVSIDPRYSRTALAKNRWGVSSLPFANIAGAAMNGTSVTIRETIDDGVSKRSVVNVQKTEEANAKVEEIRTNFQAWVWEDPERTGRLAFEYNESMNSTVTPQRNGDHLRLEGLALTLGDSEFDFRQHQRDAVWRFLQDGRGVGFHEVGTGKTFTMAGLALEGRRLGRFRKPLLFAHNSNHDTVAAEFRIAYPAAKILHFDKIAKGDRAAKLRQIQLDEWDAVIVPHSMIDKFTLKPETMEKLIEKQIKALEDEFWAEMEELPEVNTSDIDLNDEESINKAFARKSGAATAKELAKSRLRIRKRVQSRIDALPEDAIFFEDLGVDMVMVDEAHIFKKISLATRKKIKGLQTMESGRGFSLTMLTDYLKQQNNGKGVFAFTGTPVTNSLNEVYNMMQYVMSDIMAESGIDSFDDWFNSFADSTSEVELTSGNTYEPVERLLSFINVPELAQMASGAFDVVLAKDMPEFVDRDSHDGITEDPVGRPFKEIRTVISEMSEQQAAHKEEIKRRYHAFQALDGKSKLKQMRSGGDSPLIMEGEGSKAALDYRLVDPEAEDYADSKANKAVANILTHINENEKSTQMVFLEQGWNDYTVRTKAIKDGEGKPRTTAEGKKITTKEVVRQHNLVRHMVEKLVAGGVQPEEIAIFSNMRLDTIDSRPDDVLRKIHKVTAATGKEELSAMMREGKIRVAFGSSESMGTGVNAQTYMAAMHHLDAPWMPGHLEQRNGRGHRQGNKFNTIIEYRYFTEGSHDGRRWQILLNKVRFIHRFTEMLRNGGKGQRVLEGEGADTNEGGGIGDFEESFSAAAGDPRLMLRANIEKDVTRLKARRDTHLRSQEKARRGIVEAKADIARLNKYIAETEVDADKAQEAKDKEFSATIYDAGTKTKVSTWAEAKEAWDKLPTLVGSAGIEKVGDYHGFEIQREAVRSLYAGAVMSYSIKAPSGSVYSISKLSMDSIDGVLRNLRPRIERYKEEVEKARMSIGSMEELISKPFARDADLKAKRESLEKINAELELSPNPAPGWLRHGAPSGSLIYLDGKAVDVMAHRWDENGYWILFEDEAGNMRPVSYDKAMDESGNRLMPDQEFIPPVTGKETKDEQGEGKTPQTPSETRLSSREHETRERARVHLRSREHDIPAQADPFDFTVADQNPAKALGGSLSSFMLESEPDDLGFVSAVENLIIDKMAKVANPQQIIGLLNPSKHPVKKAEIEHLGIEKFLEGKKKVTKKELIEHIRSNRIKLKEVRKHENGASKWVVENEEIQEVFDTPEEAQAFKNKWVTDRMDEESHSPRKVGFDWEVVELSNEEGYANPWVVQGSDGQYIRSFPSETEANTQLEEWRTHWRSDPDTLNSFLPGDWFDSESEALESLRDKAEQRIDDLPVISPMKPTVHKAWTVKGGQNYREILLTLPPMTDKNARWMSEEQSLNYTSSHWKETNVVVHMRVDDRVDAGGNKVLFIQELQSDWAGDINKNGARDEVEIARLKVLRDEVEKRKKDADKKFTSLEVPLDNDLYPNASVVRRLEDPRNTSAERDAILERREIFKERERLTNELTDLAQKIRSTETSVPNMPFTKTYHELALKRLLRIAAEEGYDKLSWTTAKQQIDLYTDQLRRNVSKITWLKDGDGFVNVEAYDNSGGIVLDGNDAQYPIDPGSTYKGKTLDDIVGKTIAEQIRSSEDVTGTVEGDNLSIGGHFHKMLYDVAIPSSLKKFTKKWGGTVGKSTLKGADETKDYGGRVGEVSLSQPDLTQPSLDITPEMREAFKSPMPAFAGDLTEDDVNQDDLTAIRDALNELINQAPDLDRIAKIRKIAEGEPDGQRTIGNPDIANISDDPMERRAFDSVRVAYEGQLADDVQTQEELNEAARTQLELDEAGVIRDITETVADGKPLDGWQVKAAQILIGKLRSKAYATNSSEAHRQADIMTFAYQRSGTIQARAFTARRDPHKTPAERHLEFISSVMSHLDQSEEDRVSQAWTPAAKSRQMDRLKRELAAAEDRKQIAVENFDSEMVSEMNAKLKKLKQELAKTKQRRDQWEARSKLVRDKNEKIRKALTEGYGITMQDIFNGEAVMRLRGSELVKRVMKRNFEPKERLALRMYIDGFGSRPIKKATGLHRTNDVPRLKAKFQRLMKARFHQLVDQGIGLDDFAKEGDLLFEPVEVEKYEDLAAQASDLTETEKERMVQAMMDAVFPNEEALESGRVKKIDSAGSGRKYKGKKLPSKRFDPSKKEHAVQVARIGQAEVGSNGFDIAMEAWIMNILSGPQTQVVNIVGNTGNIAFEYGIQRWLEGSWNLVTGNKDGAQLGEYGAMAKALSPLRKTMPSLFTKAFEQAHMAWNTEISFFEADMLRDPAEILESRGKMEARQPAIKDAYGKIGTMGGRSLPGALMGAIKNQEWSGVSVGKTVRIPGRALLFFDTLFKSLIGQLEVIAQAYRLGKKLGLKGSEMDDFIKSQMIPGSESWYGAVAKAQELTFTNPLRTGRQGGGMGESFAKWVMDARMKKGVLATPGMFALGMLFPFIQTPFRIFQAGLRRTPLGLLGISMFHANGLVRLKKGQTYFDNETESRMARDLADQTIAWTTFGLMMAFSEGDDDDDEKMILITGSHPWKVEEGGERENSRRINGGPYMIRIGPRSNGIWIDYGRIEPMAVTLGSIVDTVRSIKRAKKGSPLSEESGRLLHYIASQTTDKTFLRGFSDMVQFWERPDVSSQTALKVLGGAMVPNLIRQPIRNLDQYARDYATAPWYYHALPLAAFAERKHDVLGEPIKKADTPLVHLAEGTSLEGPMKAVDPWLRLIWDVGYSKRDEIHPLDEVTRNWARENPGVAETYFPGINRINTYRGTDGEKKEMLPAEKAMVDRLGGQAYSQLMRQSLSQLDQEYPTEETISTVQSGRSGPFPDARDILFQGGEAPFIPEKPLTLREALFGEKKK